MNANPAMLVLVALVVLILLGLIIWLVLRGQRSANEARANEVRTQAAEHDRELREHRAAASAADAQARQAQARADEEAARAEQLRAQAERVDEDAASVEERRDDALREADRLDPQVRTDRHGNRLDTEDGDVEPGEGAGQGRRERRDEDLD